MYKHEVFREPSGLQIVHSHETTRPSGLIVPRVIGILRAAFQGPTLSGDSELFVPPEALAQTDIRDFDTPTGRPCATFEAVSLDSFQTVGTEELPKIVANNGELLMSGCFFPFRQGSDEPVASTYEMDAIQEIYAAVIATADGSDTTPGKNTGMYL